MPAEANAAAGSDRCRLRGTARRAGSSWFFVYGFEKNDKASISDDELDALQTLAKDLLARSHQQLGAAITDGSLQEICDDKESQT